MDTDRILTILRSHAPELQAAGLAHLRIFGSVARGEATPQSDIDLLADFSPGTRVSLMTLSGLRLRLTELLSAEVDLSTTNALKESVRAHVDREAVLVF
jgi:predicted nucleotidyltransferase